jgi:hypothetical protein
LEPGWKRETLDGFTLHGIASDRREAAVSWFSIGPEGYRARSTNSLVGDAELIRRAIIDEIDGRTFRATQTGPFVVADLDDAHAAVLQLGSYFVTHRATTPCVDVNGSAVLPAGRYFERPRYRRR